MKLSKTPPHLHANVMHAGESPYRAYYYLHSFIHYPIIVVVDDNERVMGVLTLADYHKPMWERGLHSLEGKTLGDICVRSFRYIGAAEDVYSAGRSIFADTKIDSALPVINKEGYLAGLFGKWQAFYREWYAQGKLHNMPYARMIMNAAELAKGKNYKEISVLEFGVSGGGGVWCAERYAMETERLTGVKIQVYGFDTFTGIPQPDVYDALYIAGDYPCDLQLLGSNLIKAQLVQGDIVKTAPSFLENYHPAPIGAMFVDVDVYPPVPAILDLLLEDHEWFLPWVFMWFDDLNMEQQFEGEWRAVSEFNARNRDIKISPEFFTGKTTGTSERIGVDDYVKIARRYTHPKFRNCSDTINHNGLKF
jgi:hypothetical protein